MSPIEIGGMHADVMAIIMSQLARAQSVGNEGREQRGFVEKNKKIYTGVLVWLGSPVEILVRGSPLGGD